ncbi:unnamed protein product [Bursaphelenchus okinawaensis]|uniref:L-serine deaminase n=1 Tax=Bursaphelenchus okinawaensis TaxID=465554 RepID=A0A811KD36_9BILA|nr:unnamed protein product [Bursaphelenchus okinawaensis]CAG9099298.1 unnamed protein product [Bursaphelenchus okinawaensis]
MSEFESDVEVEPETQVKQLDDPFCNPATPHSISFSDISTAAFNIRDGIIITPTTKSPQLSLLLGMEVYNKKEFLQVTGSFKERGARYSLHRLTAEEKQVGVTAASAGNHALALAYHGQLMNIPVTVVMPTFAPLMKISACRSYGANVILHGKDIGEARTHAFELAKTSKQKYINGFDYPDVIAGQGTIGLEILEQVKNVDAVIVPVGGGGLIAGIALAIKTLKPEVQVIGVESESCASFHNAMHNSHFKMQPESSIADGLAVPTVGVNAVYMARGIVDELVTVCEESIALAILRFLELEKSVVEGAGAVGLAAMLSGKLPQLKGKRVVNIMTGGPGGIAELTNVIAHSGASIKDIFHERAWLAANVFEVRVRVVVETREREHAMELHQILKDKYTHVTLYDKKPHFLMNA